MNQAPIGVFDSGLGGLTSLGILHDLLPGEDLVYFGDTARVPYGTRSRSIILSYAHQDISFLLSKGVKAILAACGTVSSTLTGEDTARLPVPYLGVVEPAAAAAEKATRNGHIGIIGTTATVSSGSYQAALLRLRGSLRLSLQPCPLFVPLVENGHFAAGDALAVLAASQYLAPIREAGVDTLILGCTHYPLLREVLQEEMGPEVLLIDPGREAALTLKNQLQEAGQLSNKKEGGTIRYYVSDDAEHFGEMAKLYLGLAHEGPVEKIFIEDYQR